MVTSYNEEHHRPLTLKPADRTGATLAGVTKRIALPTPLDTFVYDTRLDRDGGAWRLDSSKSWFNEPLNATYRGARRKFPEVAPHYMLEWHSHYLGYAGWSDVDGDSRWFCRLYLQHERPLHLCY